LGFLMDRSHTEDHRTMISNRSGGYLLLNLCPFENIVVSTERTAIKKSEN